MRIYDACCLGCGWNLVEMGVAFSIIVVWEYDVVKKASGYLGDGDVEYKRCRNIFL